MMETIIRYIVLVVVLGIIGKVITNLSMKSKPMDKNVSTSHYRVKAPAALKYACMSQFILGLIMFLVFSYFYMQGNETVEWAIYMFLLYLGVLVYMVWPGHLYGVY